MLPINLYRTNPVYTIPANYLMEYRGSIREYIAASLIRPVIHVNYQVQLPDVQSAKARCQKLANHPANKDSQIKQDLLKYILLSQHEIQIAHESYIWKLFKQLSPGSYTLQAFYHIQDGENTLLIPSKIHTKFFAILLNYQNYSGLLIREMLSLFWEPLHATPLQNYTIHLTKSNDRVVCVTGLTLLTLVLEAEKHIILPDMEQFLGDTQEIVTTLYSPLQTTGSSPQCAYLCDERHFLFNEVDRLLMDKLGVKHLQDENRKLPACDLSKYIPCTELVLTRAPDLLKVSSTEMRYRAAIQAYLQANKKSLLYMGNKQAYQRDSYNLDAALNQCRVLLNDPSLDDAKRHLLKYLVEDHRFIPGFSKGPGIFSFFENLPASFNLTAYYHVRIGGDIVLVDSPILMKFFGLFIVRQSQEEHPPVIPKEEFLRQFWDHLHEEFGSGRRYSIALDNKARRVEIHGLTLLSFLVTEIPADSAYAQDMRERIYTLLSPLIRYQHFKGETTSTFFSYMMDPQYPVNINTLQEYCSNAAIQVKLRHYHNANHYPATLIKYCTPPQRVRDNRSPLTPLSHNDATLDEIFGLEQLANRPATVATPQHVIELAKINPKGLVLAWNKIEKEWRNNPSVFRAFVRALHKNRGVWEFDLRTFPAANVIHRVFAEIFCSFEDPAIGQFILICIAIRLCLKAHDTPLDQESKKRLRSELYNFVKRLSKPFTDEDIHAIMQRTIEYAYVQSPIETPLTEELSIESCHTFAGFQFEQMRTLLLNLDYFTQKETGVGRYIPFFLLSSDLKVAHLTCMVCSVNGKGLVNSLYTDTGHLGQKVLREELGETVEVQENHTIKLSLDQLNKLAESIKRNKKNPQFILLERKSHDFSLIEEDLILPAAPSTIVVAPPPLPLPFDPIPREPSSPTGERNKRSIEVSSNSPTEPSAKKDKKPPGDSSAPASHQLYKERGGFKPLDAEGNGTTNGKRKKPEASQVPLPLEQPGIRPANEPLLATDPEEMLSAQILQAIQRVGNEISNTIARSALILEEKCLEPPIQKDLAKLPPLVQAPVYNPLLKPYQVEEADEMVRFAFGDLIRIVAMEMGLGKTYAACEFLLRMLLRDLSGIHLFLVPANLIGEIYKEIMEVLKEAIVAAWQIKLQVDPDRKELIKKAIELIRRGAAKEDLKDLLKDKKPSKNDHLRKLFPDQQLQLGMRLLALLPSDEALEHLKNGGVLRELNEEIIQEIAKWATKHIETLLEKHKYQKEKLELIRQELSVLGIQGTDIRSAFAPQNMREALPLLYLAGRILQIHPGRNPLSDYRTFPAGTIEQLMHLPLMTLQMGEDKHRFDATLRSFSNGRCIMVASIESLNLSKMPLAELPINTMIVDEAHEAQSDQSKKFRLLKDLLHARRLKAGVDQNKRPKFAAALLTGSPFQNNWSELWRLVTLGKNDALNPSEHKALATLLKDTLAALFLSKTADHKRLVINSFAQFSAFKTLVVLPCFGRIKMNSSKVREAWPNQLPEPRNAPFDATRFISPVAREALERVVRDFQAEAQKIKGDAKKEFSNGLDFASRTKRIMLHPQFENLPFSKPQKNEPTERYEQLIRLVDSFKAMPRQAFEQAFRDSPMFEGLFHCESFREVLQNGEQALVIIEHKITGELLASAISKKFPEFPCECLIFTSKLNTPEKRDETLRLFKDTTGPRRARLLILSVKLAIGMNLPQAFKIFRLAMMWNPSKEDQAEARALRAGNPGVRTIVELVYHLFYFAHYKAVQRVKRAWELFLWNESPNPLDQFKLWCEVLRAMCYQSSLNKTKNIEATDTMMIEVDKHITHLSEHLQEEGVEDANQRLKELLQKATPPVEIVQPKIVEAASDNSCYLSAALTALSASRAFLQVLKQNHEHPVFRSMQNVFLGQPPMAELLKAVAQLRETLFQSGIHPDLRGNVYGQYDAATAVEALLSSAGYALEFDVELSGRRLEQPEVLRIIPVGIEGDTPHIQGLINAFFTERYEDKVISRRLRQAPPFFVTQLKRSANSIAVAFPADGIIGLPGHIRYRLTACVNHFGESLHSGHYMAKVRTPQGWLHIDDHRVMEEPVSWGEQESYLQVWERY